MIARLLALAALIFCCVLAMPGVASAHVLKIDGAIGGVLHINPDDNPTTGESTDYVLSFDDYSGRFSLAGCDCTVSIIQNGRILATQPLVISGRNVSDNHYTFTAPAVYDMRFSGKPKQAGAFQPFTLNYEVRVASNNSSAQSFPPVLGIGIGLGMALILLGAYAMDYTEGVPPNKEHQ